MPLVQLAHPPRTREELWWVVYVLFGVCIPRTKVCPDHCSPFDAFADAYFGICTIGEGEPYEISRAIWHASRGLAGKSKTLSILGLTFGYVLGADITILGGSMAQSVNVHEYMTKGMESENLPAEMALDVTATRIQLTNKGRVRPLPASQKNVRGPHPSVLLMDEVDEMELPIYDAALGQPLPQPSYLGFDVETMTVVSSTWQNADGTLTEIFRRSEEDEPINEHGDKRTPIYRWCVAAGSLIVTSRGQIPIEEVTDSDLVLTRQGWRHVQHVTLMGHKPTVRLDVGDCSLEVTSDHQVAVPGGWRAAGALAADTMAAAGTDVGVLGGEGVTFPAGSGPLLVPPGSTFVLGRGDDVEVLDVDAVAEPAQVIGLMPGWDRAYDTLPDPAMRGDGGSLYRAEDDAADAVAVAFGARPVDAARGEHGNAVRAVYDIGVEGVHEFVANGIVVHNCYKENHVDNNPFNEHIGRSEGWLSQKTIDNKRHEVSTEMFRIEYDLGEPSIGNRAIDTDLLDKCFSSDREPIWEEHSKDWDEWRFYDPVPSATYAAGADWAKEEDKTAITISRTDRGKREVVYAARFNRTSYIRMVGVFNREVMHYGVGLNGAWHDSTGLGGVINDLVDVRCRAFSMTGEKRVALLSEYIVAIEKGLWVFPKVLRRHYYEHKHCRTGDLYSRKEEFHLPDTMCAGALAEHGAKRVVNSAAPLGVGAGGSVGALTKHFQHPGEATPSMTAPDAPATGRHIELGV